MVEGVEGHRGTSTPADPAPAPELAEEHVWLGGGQSYVVCAFYTPNYLPQVLNLKASLDALGINHFLKRYERRETWEATTRLKPVFLGAALARFPDHNVVYLDADAVVRQPLTFFDEMAGDVSLLIHRANARGRNYLRLASGTIFVRNSEGGRRFAAAWAAEEANSGPLTLDEDMIYMAFDKLTGVAIAPLPVAYCKIFDRPDGIDPVVEHFQASRGQPKLAKSARRNRRLALIAGIIVLAIVLASGLRALLGGS
jgi:hypothetical protein